jgi:hypothetical protein
MVSRRVTRKKTEAPGEWDRVGDPFSQVPKALIEVQKKKKNLTEREQKQRDSGPLRCLRECLVPRMDRYGRNMSPSSNTVLYRVQK